MLYYACKLPYMHISSCSFTLSLVLQHLIDRLFLIENMDKLNFNIGDLILLIKIMFAISLYKESLFVKRSLKN